MNRYANLIIILFALCIAIVHPLSGIAEIYKYQDKSGRWHFTDKPPDGRKKTTTEQKTKDKATVSETKDKTATYESIQERLYEKYKPISAIERASIAVVKVKNPLSEGSGFFVTDDGYILTNKHVVKPTETKEWKDLEEKAKETKEDYNEADRILRKELARLKRMENALKEYKKAIDEANEGHSKRMATSEYNVYLGRYREHKSKYLDVKREYETKKRAYEKARREFNIQSSSAYLRRNFDIILKDETKLTARLIDTNDDNDIALLKIDLYKTPFIQPAKTESLRQGMKIYSIGSPLRMRDVVTTGIVSGTRDKYIITDSTILPGSSGGPLVNDEGKVLGINSMRISQKEGGEGFGLAIPIHIAIEEFGKHLGNIDLQ